LAADRLGAEEGDFIFLEFLGEDRLEFHIVKRTDLQAATGPARMALEVGTTIADWDGDILAAIASALGLAGEASSDATQVRQRLTARREDDLAESLLDSVGPKSPPQTDNALERLTAALAGFTFKSRPGTDGDRDELIGRRPYGVTS
jgi:hypothetical protein